jgi:large subunit ribosomal protein L25
LKKPAKAGIYQKSEGNPACFSGNDWVRGALRKELMEEVVVKADRRTVVGKQVNALRRAGILPAILYGRHIDPMPISLDLRESSRILDRLSPSTLILIQMDGEQHYALVRDKQRNPILGTLRHVDFQAVSLTETVRTNVSIQLTGESPAVDELVGILVQNIEVLDIEALPRDLPERITVDISSLKEVGDTIYVRDLDLPAGVEVHSDPEEAVVLITQPAAEEEIEEEEVEEEEEAEPEVIEKGKREEDEEEE